MNINIKAALDKANATNDELVSIAKSIAYEYTKPIDDIITYVSSKVNTLDNNSLRALATDLSFKAYSLGEQKELASLKSECASALAKEQYAVQFNSAEGTVDARRNTAALNSSDEQLTEFIYDTVASLLKVKLDETHRIVDMLKTVILTRNSETRLNQDMAVDTKGEF